MKRNSLFVTAVIATVLAASPVLYASPLAIQSPVHAMFGGKVKNVQLSFRNDSTATLELKVGENVMTLEAGKTMSVKVPEGTRVVTNTATRNHEAGGLIVQVTTDLSGATVAIS